MASEMAPLLLRDQASEMRGAFADCVHRPSSLLRHFQKSRQSNIGEYFGGKRLAATMRPPALRRRIEMPARSEVIEVFGSPSISPERDTFADVRIDGASLPVYYPSHSSSSSSSSSADVAKKPFRTLVVVPRSHTDGTFECLCKERSSGEVKCRDPAIAARAVQLDLRPNATRPHRSLIVAWDSRLVHQGHTHMPNRSWGWSPPLKRPTFFRSEDISWRTHLNDEGYVAIADILPEEDVHKALSLLLKDLQIYSPDLKSLGEVREFHLPPTPAANDLRMSAGLCHGRFAWFLRTHHLVGQLFERLFDVPSGAPLIGSVDVVALAPPEMSKHSGPAKQWLHLDYSPPQGRIWQTTVQLFPETHRDGCMWERIAVMICKAPAVWASPRCEHTLLACCITGAASRATAGVTLGLLHQEKKERHHYIGRRLLPELAGTPLASADFCVESGSIDASKPLPDLLNLRLLSAEVAMRSFSADELRRLVPKRVLRYISPLTLFDAEASAKVFAAVSASKYGRRSRRSSIDMSRSKQC